MLISSMNIGYEFQLRLRLLELTISLKLINSNNQTSERLKNNVISQLITALKTNP